MSASTTTTTSRGDDEKYPVFLATVRASYAMASGEQLYAVDSGDLWETYLGAYPDHVRQHYNCHACRQFIERYGNLVAVTPLGHRIPVMWGTAGIGALGMFDNVLAAMHAHVAKGKVTGAFLSAERAWGAASTGGGHKAFRHLAVTPAGKDVFSMRARSAGQVMASKREDVALLEDALNLYGVPTCEATLALLRNGKLPRAERSEPVVAWLDGVHRSLAGAKGKERGALLWRAAATAPEGWCHVKNTVAGTILDDVVAGRSFEVIRHRVGEKMDPLQYQRPQAAPSDGQLDAAEKLVAKLGLARSLERRFARPDEVRALWRPPAPADVSPAGGVFGHLRKAEVAPSVRIPEVTMTWEKFRRDVLPTARSVEVFVGSYDSPWYALVTARHEDAPPVVQWDRPEVRNPVTWYTHPGGSPPQHWGSAPGFQPVYAVAMFPHMWGSGMVDHGRHGDGVLFLVEGANDSRRAGLGGGGLFPEHLVGDLREIRAAVEAYAKTAVIAGAGEPAACGVGLRKSQDDWGRSGVVRVTPVNGPPTTYRLDRWE